MTYDELIRHYGSQNKAAAAIGVHQASVSDWKRNGIPYLRQMQIEELTGRALVAGEFPLRTSNERRA